MKAVVIHQFGGVEELILEDVPRPEPQTGEVLIKIHAAGINPVDWKSRKGSPLFADKLPLILGWDVSGEVTAVGDGVTDYKIGDEVYGMVRFPEVGAAYAEYTTSPVTDICHKPHNLSHIEAAGVPLVALTAYQALFETAGLQAGQTVLIHAAAGGVGHIAVQLAKWKGATVIGTASAVNHDYLRQLGADQLIDYHTTHFDDVVHDVDVVVEGLGGDISERSLSVLKPGGHLVILTGASPLKDGQLIAKRGFKGGMMLVRPVKEHLQHITALIEAGQLITTVSHVLPLSEVQQAHQLSESGRTRGKIVLKIV